MRITTKLLRQYGNISATDDEIITLIKEHIGEIETYRNLEEDYKDIIIGEIVGKKDHPDSDKLGIYQISLGTGENIQVVAGDRSLNEGDRVAYIKPGAIVPYTVYSEAQPIVIRSMKLRGVESNGMLGSERELNVGSNHDHVMKLPIDAPIGKPFSEYYDLNDLVIDIENKGLTNRGDLFGVIGLSRELTAITGNKFESPEWFLNRKKDLNPETNCLNIEITNDAEVLCPRYMAIAIDNIQIKESPIWIKSALLKCDIQPINNIVDITNYISLLIGQPMHAFDYDKIISNDPAGNNCANITIRMAKQGEKILGLDNKIHTLTDRNMVIADSTNPIAIAGIIGGKDTEVDSSTKRVIFESANFEKNNIRRTSMELGIFTEAGTKYKHSLDAEMTLPAILKAVELSKEFSNATMASQIVDIYPLPYKSKTIRLNIPKLNSHLGTNLEKGTIKNILENLEYKVSDVEEEYLNIDLPSWRRDIDIKEDLHEDIARVYGYNNIELKLPNKNIYPPQNNQIFELKKNIRNILSQNGANEILTYSFTSPENFKQCNLNPDLAFKIKNAQSPELSLMRTTLLQSILQKTKENIQKGFEKFGLYELNIAHLTNSIDENNLPKEEWYLSMVLTNNKRNEISGSPYYTAKKYLEKILSSLGYADIKYTLTAESSENSISSNTKNIIDMFDPNRSAIVSVYGTELGIVGELKENIMNNFKLPEYTGALEISLSKLVDIEKSNKKYSNIPIYPIFSLDLCFEVNNKILYQDIYNELEYILNKDDLYGRVDCLDIYQDRNNLEKKRITFRITASNYTKTSTEKDIQMIVEKISKKIKEKYAGELI